MSVFCDTYICAADRNFQGLQRSIIGASEDILLTMCLFRETDFVVHSGGLLKGKAH